MSGPLLDRIDLHVDVPSTDVSDLRTGANTEETSATARGRVCAARRRRQVGAATRLTEAAERLLARAARSMALSARGIARTVGVARTIACLAGNHETDVAHVSEALQYRVPSDYAQNATTALAANA